MSHKLKQNPSQKELPVNQPLDTCGKNVQQAPGSLSKLSNRPWGTSPLIADQSEFAAWKPLLCFPCATERTTESDPDTPGNHHHQKHRRL